MGQVLGVELLTAANVEIRAGSGGAKTRVAAEVAGVAAAAA